MKITHYLMASGAVALSLLIATPALAHSNVSLNGSAESRGNSGLHLGSVIRLSSHNHGVKKDHKNKEDNEHKNKKERKAFARNAFIAAIGAADVGIATSVSGSTFVLKSLGTNGTTTVTTNASTTYKVNGVAATSSALTVGSRVIVFGTGSSSTGITASLVSILNVGIGFFNHFLH